jgi:hypothetical protein
MNSPPFTDPIEAASDEPGGGSYQASQGPLPGSPVLALAALALLAGGCVSVKAPDKPIVIELNVNIRQEVVYRLAEDAGKTIQSNPDIF